MIRRRQNTDLLKNMWRLQYLILPTIFAIFAYSMLKK